VLHHQNLATAAAAREVPVALDGQMQVAMHSSFVKACMLSNGASQVRREAGSGAGCASDPGAWLPRPMLAK